MCLSCICLLTMHTLICVTFSLPPGVRGWLRLLLVALPALFCTFFFRGPAKQGHVLIALNMYTPMYEPRHEKTCLRGLRLGKIQTGLLSYTESAGNGQSGIKKKTEKMHVGCQIRNRGRVLVKSNK